jgi:Anaphase-promoting complex, cyclosome, subunit 4
LKRPLAIELAELTLRGTMSPELLAWIKNDLTNTNILNNSTEKCDKHCKQIQDEIIQKIQPAMHTVLESYYSMRGILKARYTLGGDNSICGLGLDLASLSDVIGRLEEMSALFELMLKDVS